MQWKIADRSAAICASQSVDTAWDCNNSGRQQSLGGESNAMEAVTPGGPESRAATKVNADWNSHTSMLHRHDTWGATSQATSDDSNWSSEGQCQDTANASWRRVAGSDGSGTAKAVSSGASGDNNWSEDKLESGRWRGLSIDQSHSNTDDVFDVQSGSAMQGWGAPPSPSTVSMQTGGNRRMGFETGESLWVHGMPIEPKAGKTPPMWSSGLDDAALETSSIWGPNALADSTTAVCIIFAFS